MSKKQQEAELSLKEQKRLLKKEKKTQDHSACHRSHRIADRAGSAVCLAGTG